MQLSVHPSSSSQHNNNIQKFLDDHLIFIWMKALTTDIIQIKKVRESVLKNNSAISAFAVQKKQNRYGLFLAKVSVERLFHQKRLHTCSEKA